MYHCTTKAGLAGIVSSGTINESAGPGDCRHCQSVYTTTALRSQGCSKIGANAFGSGKQGGEHHVKFRMPAEQAEQFEGHTACGDH